MAVVAPSILAADFVNLARDISMMERAGAEIIHVDVMDGHFVPNLTIGPPVLRAIRRTTDLTLDVHLMISNTAVMVDSFLEAGADRVSVHYEGTPHLDEVLSRIRNFGAKPGVVLNPHTSVQVLEEILWKCDSVLIMSVNPGYGGQEIIPTSFDKVKKLRKLIRSQNLDVEIAIDGGIGPANTAEAAAAGVDILIAGSAIFNSDDPAQTFHKMTEIAQQASANI